MRRMPRRVGAGLAVVIAIAAVIGIVLAVESPSSSGGTSGGSQSSGATTVQRRNLVETDTESGTLSYANPQTVYGRLSGTITWLPSVGQVIKAGDALYKVNGDPVILMKGSTPAYRDLSAADTAGPDILELNRNLVRLGFNPDGIVADDVWQPATTDAVEVFQESLGQEPTGVLTLGQIVFLPGDQVVSALETSVGSTGGGGSPSNSSAADLTPAASRAEFVSLTKTTTTPQAGKSPAKARHHKKSASPKTLSALLALLKAETAELRAAQAELRAAHAGSHGSSNGSSGSKSSGHGSSNSSHPSSAGGSSSGGGGSSNGGGSSSGGGNPSSGSDAGGGSASAILQTSSTHLVATVDLDASKQSEAKVGEKVTVEMPSGNTVNGTVTAVSSVAQTSDNSGNGNGNGNGSGNGNSGSGNSGSGSSTATIPVTISLSGHIAGAGLDQAAVSVAFAQAEANNVLSVPVTALLAISGGHYAVQEAAAPHKLIPVTTGLFAAGFVQISGPGIYPGLQVTDSQG